MDGDKTRRLSGPLRAGLVAAAVALLVVPLAALGESGDGSSGDADRDQARQKFEDCLRDNGVDLPKEGEGPLRLRLPDDVTLGKLRAAHEKCDHLLPAGGPRHFLMKRAPAEVREKMREFRDCMRRNGVELPEPSERPGRHELPAPPPGTEGGPDLEKLRKAERECGDLLPGPPGGARAFPGPLPPCDREQGERRGG
jgi:hypothetical protein